MLDLGNENCDKCGLCELRKNVVNGKGSTDARILLVSEWPGQKEDETGDIFKGPVAQETFRLLGKAGISKYEVFLTTTVRCYPKAPPPVRIRDPKPSEIEACSKYLDREIYTIKPNVIVPMGTLAAKRVLGERITIKKARGVEFWSDKYNCKIMPVYHPLVIRRKPQFERFTIEDFRRIRKSSDYKELTPREEGNYKVVDNLRVFDKLVSKLNSINLFAYDIETTGLSFPDDKVLCISFSGKSGTGITLPMLKYAPRTEEYTETVDKPRRKKNKKTGKMEVVSYKKVKTVKKNTIDEFVPYWGDKQQYVIDELKKVFSNDSTKVAHNGKFDNKFLLKDFGFEVTNFRDTMLEHYLIDENSEGMHGLKECAWNYTTMGGYEEQLESWFKENSMLGDQNRKYYKVPPEMLYEYAAKDADCCFRLHEVFYPIIKEEDLDKFYETIIIPLQFDLMKAEMRGILFDKDYKPNGDLTLEEELTKESNERLANLERKYGKINFNSPDQLAKLLFDDLKLPVIETTDKGKRSCKEAVLVDLKKYHEAPGEILEYRNVNHLLGLYVKGLKKRLDSNSVLHTTFSVQGTVTGRLASTNPNLQNIVKPSIDPRFKNQFIPRPGYIFLEADYGQAEFRHWANYSQDKKMIDDIIAADKGTGPDIHKKTASDAWNIPIDKVDKVARNNAKRVVFGIMYGRGADSIAEQLNIKNEDAQKIIDKFLETYPVAAQWLKDTVRFVKNKKYIRNIFGRIRRLPGIESPLDYVRNENERLAMNSPIQSAASDMNCIAAHRIIEAFKRENIDGHLLNLVHDSILYEVKKEQKEKAIDIIIREMETPMENISVPMKVELGIGERWGSIKEHKPEVVTA